jgi:hypothetical protein
MGGQPFWLVKVTHLSQRHITLWYLGDKFLGLYTPLLNEGNTKHEFEYARDETILHWNIALTMVAAARRRTAGDCLLATKRS